MHFKSKLLEIANLKYFSFRTLCKLRILITLFDCAKYFKFVSFLLYPTEVKRLKCAMLGAFTVLIIRLAQCNLDLTCAIMT